MSIIDQYESGGARLKSVIAGLSADDVQWHPPADADIGRWSIQQVVIHLMDADLIWSARMKTIIAEENPVILSFNETQFADRLFYDEQDVARAVEIFDLNRQQVGAILRKLPAAAFARTGHHSQAGPITLENCIGRMIEHLDHHLRFIQLKVRTRGQSGR